MPRSLLDMAITTPFIHRSRAILIAGCQQGMCQPEALSESLTRRGPCRHRRLLRETIADAAGGIESLPERDFDILCSRLGLPRPSRQQLLRRPDGHYYIDRYWPEFDLCCEVHGIPHLGVQQWDADVVRQNEIVIAGPRLLVFTSFAVRYLERLVADQMMRFVRSTSRAA
jgi:very-short-patch-repair endonuclease